MAVTSPCNHRIEIANLSEGEKVYNPIVLVKGLVGSRCQNTIQLEQIEEGTPSLLLKTVVSRTGEFKFLLDFRQYERKLDPINLSLHFRYCRAEFKLHVEYQSPKETIYRLQPLYIVCREEDVSVKQERDCEIIELNLRLVQGIYAEKIRAAGFGRCTFVLNDACQLFQSQLSIEEAQQLSEDDLWQHFAEELLNSEWGSDSHLKFVAFIACTKYDGAAVVASEDHSYANIRRHLKAHAALGGGGLALFGSAFFYAWPRYFNEIIKCFQDNTKVDLSLLPDDSNYRRTHGGVYATTLGAISHELGHIFDLGHTSDGVMGTDFDYVNRVFTVDNLTEHLPRREIKERVANVPQTEPKNRGPRFTNLRGNSGHSFLNKYHEQKNSDSFYFTRNCAVILAHHKWLNCDANKTDNRELTIEFDDDGGSIVSKSHPLKLVEVRSKTNSLVSQYYEFQKDVKDVAVFRFRLPEKQLQAMQHTHYIFVLTTDGHTQKISLTDLSGEHRQKLLQ